MSAPTHDLVLHSGALGDFVLIWPLLRALAGEGRATLLAARVSHARLAVRLLGPGITALDADGPRFTRLWEGPGAAVEPDLTVARVWTFVLDPRDADHPWFAAARAAYPAAVITAIGPPGSASRARVWGALPRGAFEPLSSPRPGGPVAAHAGAGSPAKRWPLSNFVRLGERLKDEGCEYRLLAGFVEREQWSPRERAEFASAGGVFIEDLDRLADALLGCGVYIGADTGPTHLAAALGLRTLALFGPTDPEIWAPKGAHVTVMRAAGGRMDALSLEAVWGAVRGSRIHS